MTSGLSLPSLIWAAASPPIPPFRGGTLKAQCALTALASETEIDLVTFAPRGQCEEISAQWREFWGGAPIRFHVLEQGSPYTPLQALRARRFQSGAVIDNPSLHDLLDRLAWNGRERLVIFDDIIFAPLAVKYGASAILSPHDCISEMSKSHFRYAASRDAAIKFWFQYRIARHYERSFYHRALLTHVVTERDRCLLERINSDGRYHVVPFIDENAFMPVDPAEEVDDVLVWADLRISATVSGVRAFLKACSRDAAWLQSHRVILVGKVSDQDARHLLGRDLPASVLYSPYLEEDSGKIRQAKVTVVPDLGGSGLKSRCLSVLFARKCLACLYFQMEGLESVCDTGAINAATMDDLVAQIKMRLADGTYREIAATGGRRYEREFSAAHIRQRWIEMVQRAAMIRNSRLQTPSEESGLKLQRA
jgi:hypothetical protein